MEINGDWDTNEIFDLHLYNHLKINNMHMTAEAFRRDTRLDTDREITPEGDLLREWWTINYDVLQPALQMSRQVPQQDVSVEAEQDGTQEENVNNSQAPEAENGRNPEKLPMNLADFSKTAEHPAAVLLSAELQEQQEMRQLFRQFLDENIAAGSSHQQQVYPEQDHDRLAKGKAIDIQNITIAKTDPYATTEVAALGTGSSNGAGLSRRFPPPLPLTGWPFTPGGIGPLPVLLGSRNTLLRAAIQEPQLMPTPGRGQGHFFQLPNSQINARSIFLGCSADQVAPKPTFSRNLLQNALSLVQARQSDELRAQMQQLQEIGEAQIDRKRKPQAFAGVGENSFNFREVEDKHNHEKAAAGTFSSQISNQAESFSTQISNQAENSSMPLCFSKRKHTEWKTKLEGIVFEEIGWLQSSKNKLLCCHFSSNGKLLVSAGHDKKVFIWNMDTFAMTETPEDHTHMISDVRFCPNSNVFATSSFDKTLEIWDANGGKSIGKLVGHTEAVVSLDFHPRKVNLMCSSHIYGEIRLWNVNRGVSLRISKDSPRFPLTHRQGASRQVRFDPHGGNLLAASSGNTIRIIDVETDSTQLYLEGHKDDVRTICWDLTGRYIASVSEDSARIFSIASGGQCIHELHSNGYSFQSCTFHPKYSELLVLGSYQSIGLWNPVEGRKSMNHCVHDGIVAALSASPQTGMVASASHDECVKIWK